MTMVIKYARLGASPEEDVPSTYHDKSTPQLNSHLNQQYRPYQRTLLLLLLLLLSFIFVFTFTLLLSLLLGDVRHQRSDVLFYESSVFEEELPFARKSSSFSSELSIYGQNVDAHDPEVAWSAIEARLPKFDRQNLPTEQLTTKNDLLNLHNFTFSSTAERTLKRCRSMKRSSPASLNLVILIHSAVEHFAHRKRLRKSWLSLDDSLVPPGTRIAHAFILGQTKERPDEQMMTAISMENRLYGDIVQANGFIDSYHNLTYKHLAGLRWSVQFGCAPVADYLLKVDDDAFVDMYAVMRYLATKKAKHSSTALMCSLFPEGTAPKRTGKWALSYSAYPFQVFPAYCSGVGYFLRPQLANELLAASSNWQDEHQPIIPIDDVFVTGLLRSTLRPPVKATAITGQYVYDVRKLRRWLEESGDCPSGYLIGDIGNELDGPSLLAKLRNKTERAWRRHQFENGSFRCPQSTIVKVSSL